jgi:beta-lactamase class A
LYGVRLLILGVGLAAIAGTLLSALNPQRQGNPADNSPATPEAATPVVAQRQPSGTAVSPNNLTAGEDITYLATDLLELAGMAPGLTPSAFVLDLDTGRYVNLDGEVEIAAASTIKVPVLVAFFAAVDAGRITLDQAVTLTQDQIVGGSGDLQTDAVGTRYTAYEVATAMIINSDNTATEMIIDLLGGPAALNQTFQSWGLGSTILRNPLPDLEGTNTTSALDLVKLMALVEQGDLLSLRSRDRLLAIMQRTYARDLIPAGIDESAIVFNKTGDIGGLLGDVALVEAPNGKRYALAVLVQRPHNDGRAAELIRRMAETVHGEMNQPIAPVGGEPTRADDTATSPLEDVAPNTASDVPQG